jgi:hypothetical protein
MSPISDEQARRYRCVRMYGDESVLDAVAALRDEQGHDWWYLIVELEDGRYAAAPFSKLAVSIQEGGADFLSRPLGELAGDPLPIVEVVKEQTEADARELAELAADTLSSAAVVLCEGDFLGIMPAGGTRGAFDVGIVNLAGRYADLPEAGLLSRRRAKSRRGRKTGKKDDKPEADSPSDDS